MSGKIKKCCLLHEEKTWTRSRVSQNLNFGRSKHRKEARLLAAPFWIVEKACEIAERWIVEKACEIAERKNWSERAEGAGGEAGKRKRKGLRS